MDSIQGKKNIKRNAIKKMSLLLKLVEGLSLLDPLVLVEINLV